MESADCIEQCSGLGEKAKGIRPPVSRAPSPSEERARCALGAPRRGGWSPGGRTRPGGAPKVRKGSGSRGWRRGGGSAGGIAKEPGVGAKRVEGAGAGGALGLLAGTPNAARSLTSIGLLSCYAPGRAPGTWVRPVLGPPRGLSGRADGTPRSPGTPRWCWVCFRPAGPCTPCGRDTSVRAFVQGTLAERLLCALRLARGPSSTQTARSYPAGAHRPTGLIFWSLLTFCFPDALEKPCVYRSSSINVC